MNTVPKKDAIEKIVEESKDKDIIMIGEATHGTSEFYVWRAHLTREIIKRYDVDFIGIEGDWPATRAYDKYVRKEIEDVAKASERFSRWPTWMWSNWEVISFLKWLRKHNEGKKEEQEKVSFFGLDIYSLHESIYEIHKYAKEKELDLDIEAFTQCFSPIGDEETLMKKLSMVPEECEEEITELLCELRGKSLDREGFLDTEMNAEIVASARDYYKSIVSGDSSWNVRDRHMHQTMKKLRRKGKIIIWAHNTHVGDARFTDMKEAGLVNTGQLAREDFGDKVIIIGQSTFSGTVIAGRNWGSEMEAMDIPEAKIGSWDLEFQKLMPEGGLIDCKELEDTTKGQRAVGVVYNPALEPYSNYVPTKMRSRYDYVVHFPKTHALHPLKHDEDGDGKIPETYPFGF